MMLLYETPAGYALFKVLDKSIVGAEARDLSKEFASPEGAAKLLKLKEFCKFEDTAKALAAASAICDDKLDKSLKRFLKEHVSDSTKLAVGDAKLGQLIKKKLDLSCVFDDAVNELMRGVRTQLESLVGDVAARDREAMRLGLSHSLCRYKLKFSPDKVDTMIIQAIGLLDELDKELNIYAMRCREWYGWHFPEMGKIVLDNIQYAKVVMKVGRRTNTIKCDLSDVIDEDVETELKEAAEMSMGTEVAEDDIVNVQALCKQVVDISNYRAELFEYLRQRMQAIAPNTTVMVGELVGARLIAHAGSLLSLAKHPASTVQILGAEKALFRALKTKHDTPKYGLIFNASLVGQAAPKNRGKISRVLAAKTSLAVRADALGDGDGVTIGHEMRTKVETRLRVIETGRAVAVSGNGKSKGKQSRYEKPADAARSYNDAADAAMDVVADDDDDDDDSSDVDESPRKKAKKDKKKKSKKSKRSRDDEEDDEPSAKKRKSGTPSKSSRDSDDDDSDDDEEEEKSKKSKKKKSKKSKKSKK